MLIQGYQKTTLLDYPGKVASTVFTGGCNFRCPYCHNGHLVLNSHQEPTIPMETIITHLKKRQKVLEGVCISGGEPTLQQDLISFIQQIKEMSLKVKLDTNGSHPDLLKELLEKKLVDYVAMDIKNSFKKYPKTIGVLDFDCSKIKISSSLLMEQSIPYEFRTTIVKELHQEEDLFHIGEWLKGASAYFLQQYKESPYQIQKGFTPYSKETLHTFAEKLQPFFQSVGIRGVD